MSSSTGYIPAISDVFSDKHVYCVVCPGGGQNTPRIWGKILNDVLENNYNSPGELEELAEQYNCFLEEINTNNVESIRLPVKYNKKGVGRLTGGKYSNLKNYLESIPTNQDVVTLSFKEIEEILSAELPNSAKVHRPWWANGGHSQANAWLDAGYKESIDVIKKTNLHAPMIK